MRLEVLGAPASRRRDAGAPRQERGKQAKLPGIFVLRGAAPRMGTYIGLLREKSLLGKAQRHGSQFHGSDDVVDMLVERQAKQFRAGLDVFAPHGGGK